MAQRDLDAALQLLADRAQFITGATGAAIALRRQGRNDMLCRASTGSNAPELGALLSTEFGLSGESVRTKQLLRCDDAERDARVNREVCRQLGIASVVVMPVVRDDEVLGVFELFSGRTNAFGERDLSAVQRLGQMVETAVQLAEVTEKLPQKLKAEASAAAQPSTTAEDEILDEHILEVEAAEPPPVKVQEPDVLPSAPDLAQAQPETEVKSVAKPEPIVSQEVPTLSQSAVPASTPEIPASQSPVAKQTAEGLPPVPPENLPAKPLLWSARNSAAAEKPLENDLSHVPPVLRGLRKCEACGFPISGGRVLCVECEEKKWRGQLKRPQPMPTGAVAQSSPATSAPQAQPAPHAAAATSPTSRPVSLPLPNLASPVAPAPSLVPAEQPATANAPAAPPVSASTSAGSPAAMFVLTGGLEESQSWFSSNRYVIAALILVVVLMAAFFFLR